MQPRSIQEEPTEVKHELEYNDEVEEEEEEEEEEVGLLGRKKGLLLSGQGTNKAETADGENGGGSGSSSSSAVTSISSSPTSDSSSKSISVGADESNGKEAVVDGLTGEDHELTGEDHDGSVYLDKEQGVESNGVSGTEPAAADENLDGEVNHKSEVQNGVTDEVNHQLPEIEEISSEDSREEHNASLQSKSNSQGSPDAVVIEEELDVELSDEYDVEKVLENQQTHDLYCPNCNSCITSRVVLKRRKRKIRYQLDPSKREKLESADHSKSDANQLNPIQGSNDGGRVDISSNDGGAGGDGSERGPCLFRCLSCFSIFIPTVNGFRLFPLPKVKESEIPLNSQQATMTGQTNCFSFIFGTKEKETVKERGTSVVPDTSSSQASPVETDQNQDIPVSSTAVSSSVEQPQTQVSKDSSVANGNMQPVQDFKLPQNKGSLSPIPPSTDIKVVDTVTIGSHEVRIDPELPLKGGYSLLQEPNKGSLSPLLPSIGINVVDTVTIGSYEVRIDPELPLKTGSSLLQEPKVDNWTKLGTASNDNITGGQLTVLIDPGTAEPKLPQSSQSNIPRESDPLLQGQTPDGPERRDNAATEVHKPEILKSIVYGGLIESITSLGVVSSAAGSGASTLNIFVLGLANLIGGLVLIVHNLQELKNENPSRSPSTNNTQSNEQEDRYQELLGRRQNYRLHAFVAILSFVIFGLIPPVVYGFSFRENDNKDYKAASALAASLVCIILLAIGKAHTGKPHKTYIKTVLYYASIGIAASGISYIVGDLVSYLIEKYGWFDSNQSPAQAMLPLLDGKSSGLGRAWGSY